MKTRILFMLFLLCISNCFSQTIPINENNKYLKNYSIKYYSKSLLDLKSQEEKMKIQIDSLKKSSSTSPIQNKMDSIKIADLEKKVSSSQEEIKERNAFEAAYDKKIKKINDEIKIIQNEIYNSTDPEEMIKKREQKNKLLVNIESIQKERDENIFSYYENYSWFLPSKNPKLRKKFFGTTYNNNFDKTKVLNTLAINANDNGTAIQSELLADYMAMFRLSFGTVLTNASDSNSSTSKATAEEEAADALNRLINGGGNFYLDATLPIATTFDGKPTDIYTVYLTANFRGACDIKNMSNNIDTSTGNGSAGLNLYASASSLDKKFNFFIQSNINYVIGSKDFYKNLKLTDEKNFISGKISAGVTLLNSVRMSAIINTFGSDEALRSGKVIFGIQILPS